MNEWTDGRFEIIIRISWNSSLNFINAKRTKDEGGKSKIDFKPKKNEDEVHYF